MNNAINLYKKFIDGLVNIHKCVNSSWVRKGNYPEVKDNEKINQFLKGLNSNEKDILADMLQDAYDSGIHDTLAYIDEKIECDNLQLVEDGTEYVTDEFDSMHFDFICRKEGDSWPE